jgi:hypothetical protein
MEQRAVLMVAKVRCKMNRQTVLVMMMIMTLVLAAALRHLE